MLERKRDDKPSAADARGRELERFSEEVAEDLGLGCAAAGRVRAALATLRKLPIVWFQFAPAARASDAFARCTAPWAGDILYAQLPAAEERGPQAADPKALTDLEESLRGAAGRYLCVIEGPLPVQGPPALARVVRTALKVCSSARAVLCVGAVGAGALAAARMPGVLDALGSPAVHIGGGAPPTAAALAAALVTKLAGSALRPTAAPVPGVALEVVR